VDDFEAILTQPSASLIKQYQALLATEGVTLRFTEGAVRRIAELACQVNERTENIGARRLSTMLERLLDELSFQAPNLSGQEHLMDLDEVNRRLSELAGNEDLSRFIL
jgi:ATP-dependent HslUV protease ATP-binding subunit HslU